MTTPQTAPPQPSLTQLPRFGERLKDRLSARLENEGSTVTCPTFVGHSMTKIVQKTVSLTLSLDHYAKGYVQRTPDHDKRVAAPFRPMSLVVDCIK